MNSLMLRAMAWQAKRHTYGFEGNELVIREPASGDGAIVCRLTGEAHHPATIMQANAICEALDRLAAEQEG